MPLSEDEKRILKEIEQQLKEQDPHLAREVSSYTVFRHTFRNLRWAALGIVVGAAVIWLSLSRSVFVAFAGFLVMFASAMYLERNVRRLGRAGVTQLAQRNPNRRSLRQVLDESRRRMRDREDRD